MSNSFTPGPWVATEYEAGCGSAFVRIGDMTVSGTYRGGAEDTLITEDARLIAAAPELFESLQVLTGVYESMRQTLAEKYPNDGWTAKTMTLDQARAAIAKVTGEQA